MKVATLHAILLAGVLASSCPAQTAEGAPEGAAKSVGELVEELGASSFAEREVAEQELVERGEAARVDLLKARKSSDPEVRWRAARALTELDRLAEGAAAPKSQEPPALRDPEPQVAPRPLDQERRELEGRFESEDGRSRSWYRLEGTGLRDREWDELREELERNPRDSLEDMLKGQHDRMRQLESDFFGRFGGREDPWSMRLHAGSFEEMNEMVEQLERQMDDLLSRELGGAWSSPEDFWRAPRPVELPEGPRLGIHLGDMTPALRAQLALDEGVGVLISRVVAGSIAERAGVQTWDVITAVSGKPVATGRDVIEALQGVPVGASIEIDVMRQARRQTLTAERDR